MLFDSVVTACPAQRISTNRQCIKGSLSDPLLAVALVMTVIGFGFKVAAVPFHFWAPDVYEGDANRSAALIASGKSRRPRHLLYK